MSEPSPRKAITVTGQSWGEWRITADTWTATETGYLGVFDADRIKVAEFAIGQWSAVIDEAHRKPDSVMKGLAIARAAMAAIFSAKGLDEARTLAERALKDSEDYL